jgi:hypothetical protein
MLCTLYGMNMRFFNIPLLMLLLCSPAQADEGLTPMQFKGIYQFEFSDVPIGKMGLEIDQSATDYSINSDILTTGVLKMFVNHSSHTTADGSGKHFRYDTVKYDSNYRTRKKKKAVSMRFKNGKIVEEKLNPPDNRATRPAVSDELKTNAIDPLSLILRIRQELFEARKNDTKNFSINGYDGRRLTTADFTVIGTQNLRYKGKKVPVIKVDARRTLVAGFTQSELADKNDNEPPAHIYFTNDAQLKPIKVEAVLWMGTVSATLIKECMPSESCLFGIKE